MSTPEKDVRRALMIAKRAAKDEALEQAKANAGKEIEDSIYATENPNRILIKAKGTSGARTAKGIVVPRHMWFGQVDRHGNYTPGMKDVNEMRAKVYGAEHRDPLTIGQFSKIHSEAIKEHFNKPVKQQKRDELEAKKRLRAAGHLAPNADTLKGSEKLDTVRFEPNPTGGGYEAFASKGVAGHALYASGSGKDTRFRILNTCPGQTEGCSGGVDSHGVIDTSRGTCFAPNAEAQYVDAAVGRASHAQAKADPAMTRDWIIAHIGSLRNKAESAHRNGNQLLFRPNVVDESDTTSRLVIGALNRQFASDGRKIRPIISNQYGKTDELHDPENGIFVTYSNTGPKVKDGYQINENIKRDNNRVSRTILAQALDGKDLKNEQGNKTPPKGSYLVTNVKRYSPTDQRMQQAFKHAKYWSVGREQGNLSDAEKAEGDEAHYGGNGQPTSPDQAHYGHVTMNGRRYDYQKQHILHPRPVHVGQKEDKTTGEVKDLYVSTDSRFKDEEHLPQDRFKSRSGKNAGHILMTTPTESTSGAQHDTEFTHPVDEAHLAHAAANNGEYQIDAPELQEAARGRNFPKKSEETTIDPASIKRRQRAFGGAVDAEEPEPLEEYMSAFPEQSYAAQRHNAHRDREGGMSDEKAPAAKEAIVDRAMQLTRPKTGLPASVRISVSVPGGRG
jgi:hypothetical protein